MPTPTLSPTRKGVSRRTVLLWIALLVVTLCVVNWVPLLYFRRYFFTGDTQNAYYPWWYYLGDQIRHGVWPIMEPQRWQAGNFAAEGQWGLFSPLTILIGLGATVVPNAVLYTVMVKTGLTLIGGVGTFTLGRHYKLPCPAAYVLAVAVSLAGSVQFLDWPSWVAGQMAACLLPWAWWGLRRIIYDRASPWPALVAGYLIVTIGYVYGTLYLGVVVVGCLVECLVVRDRRAFLRVILTAIPYGLVAATVYLPGVLTSPVTVRNTWDVVPVGRQQGDLGRMLTAMVPLGSGVGYYVAWFLPLLAWIDVRRLRATVRPLSGAVVGLGVMALWLLGPNQIGPIRWPTRVGAIYDFFALVVVVVVFARCATWRPSGRRLAASVVILLFGAFVILPRSWEEKGHVVVGTLVACAGIVGAWLLLRLSADPTRRARVTAMLAIFVVTVGVVLQVIQHDQLPRPSAMDRNTPALTKEWRTQLPDARGDVMIIGDPQARSVADPAVSRELLIASAWYLNPHPVANADTAISYRAYTDRFCMRYNGSTICRRALNNLFETESTTGRPWVDLMSVSTVVIVRGTVSRSRILHPPDGWHIATRGRFSVTWVRDQPVPGAGGVVATSSGVSVRTLSRSDREVRFEVTGVPESGGSVTLSRLAWPGYHVTGADLGKPLDDMLVTVDVDHKDRGKVVTARFDPPHWSMLLIAWWLGVLLSAGLVVTQWVARRRRVNNR